MGKLLHSSWAATFLGSLLYLGTTIAVWNPPPVSSHEDGTEAEPRRMIGDPGASWNFHNPEVDRLVEELRAEKAALTQRETQLAELSARLQAERLEINQVTQQVHTLQVEFDRNILRVKDEETANLKKLAKMYAAMSPEGSAAIFKQLDDATLVKIMLFMKESEKGPILDTMAKQGDTDTKRAATLSEKLRLSLPPPGPPKGGAL